jgi:hypothetical protein
METMNIKHNEGLKGVEITFEVKPSQDVIEFLKANNFRFSRTKKCWYARENKYTFLVLEDLKALLGLENKSQQTQQFLNDEQPEHQGNEVAEVIPTITSKAKFVFQPIINLDPPSEVEENKQPLKPVYVSCSPSSETASKKIKPTDIVKKVKKVKDLSRVDFDLLHHKNMLLLRSTGLVSITQDNLDNFIQENKGSKVRLEYIGKDLLMQVTV